MAHHPAKSLEVTGKGPLVLLFYDGYERRARPGILGGLHSQSRRLLRYLKRTACRQQVRSGLYTAFLGLVKSLESVGCDVRINAFAEAAKRPDYPIGLTGFPSVLDKVPLPNPKIFGPGDFGLPEKSARVMDDPSFITLIQPSPWACDLYRPACDGKIWPWFAGIDTHAWPDLSAAPKIYDFVIYDKIHWHRDRLVPEVLERILAHLKAHQQTYLLLRYGQHHHSQYRAALRQSRALLYLSQHETQGIACQEAMSSNVPVLAWNPGIMEDPAWAARKHDGVAVTSVPYFDARCGLTFTMDNFEAQHAQYMEQRHHYQPRAYVLEQLSLPIAGKRYLAEYQRIAEGCITPRE